MPDRLPVDEEELRRYRLDKIIKETVWSEVARVFRDHGMLNEDKDPDLNAFFAPAQRARQSNKTRSKYASFLILAFMGSLVTLITTQFLGPLIVWLKGS